MDDMNQTEQIRIDKTLALKTWESKSLAKEQNSKSPAKLCLPNKPFFCHSVLHSFSLHLMIYFSCKYYCYFVFELFVYLIRQAVHKYDHCCYSVILECYRME